MSCAFSLSQMAEILHVSRSTVKRRLRRLNLSQAGRFSDLSDTALDDKVKDLVAGNDRLGPESVRAQLRAEGIRVQRRRVRDSMLRVKPRAAALRAMSQRLHRRSYRVAGPNSLWHLDGNHKLIRWRIVIHGGIDGYSRLVVFLRASSNNRSSTAQDGEAQDGVAGTPVVHWIERVTIPPNRFTLGNALMQPNPPVAEHPEPARNPPVPQGLLRNTQDGTGSLRCPLAPTARQVGIGIVFSRQTRPGGRKEGQTGKSPTTFAESRQATGEWHP
ncbi:uncharacterized protein LOC134028269 [Osmerus eperlanus]|uniref:uncharacterized protein LOC134028269 n=1 Tax=Osmerus eperlanus TaxID=29151 RepID=UPI002E15AB9E